MRNGQRERFRYGSREAIFRASGFPFSPETEAEFVLRQNFLARTFENVIPQVLELKKRDTQL